MLSLQAVNQFYGDKHVLWNLNLDLVPGECACVIGAPGMGKSTLMNCITGHIPVHSGTMIWQPPQSCPENIMPLSAAHRSQMGIAHLPREDRFFTQLTVEENLQIAMLAGKPSPGAVPHHIYDLFPALHGLRHLRAAELSEANLQQLALARALMTHPKLLILDEPLRRNTPQRLADMATLLRRLTRELGITILMVEQHLSFIRRTADRFILLHRGRNVAHGDVTHLNTVIGDWMEP